MTTSQSFSVDSRLRIDAGRVNAEYNRTPHISVEVTPTSPVEPNSPYSPTSPFEAFASPQSEHFPFKQSRSSKPNASNANRARNESRKLLAVLLGQLQARPMPPSVFDPFKETNLSTGEKGLGAVVDTVKGAVKFKSGKREQRPGMRPDSDDEEDDGDRKAFSTDYTFDLMNQLKDVLVISVAQGWQIFYDSSIQEVNERHPSVGKSPFRLRRQSAQGGRRSRSSSPNPGGTVQAPELLSQCISILSTIVAEDCRFQISSPRPSRPSNALQAVTLDVAQFLVHTHRHDPKIVSRIGFALIPAFATFRTEMHARLLSFFEEAVIRGVLEELGYLQGTGEITQPTSTLHAPGQDDADQGIPVVSIQVDQVQDDMQQESRINSSWTPWLSQISDAVTLQSTNAPLQSLPIYYLASLTAPLLAAMFESVDFSVPSLPTAHRFYRLLRMIVDLKPDAYSDILQVVAYHTAKARLVALSVLATFWPKAVGHAIVSRPLPVVSYIQSLRQAETGAQWYDSGDHAYAHQFVPWRFESASRPPGSQGLSHYDCRSCTSAIRGFGLLCPFCMCAVHLDCYDYPDGCFSSQYTMASDPNLKKIALDRFCYVLPARRDRESRVVVREEHVFRLVNLFNLSLCFICRQPLWGCYMQGLKCTTCHQSVHVSCLSDTSADLPRCRTTKIDSSHLTVDWALLRRTFVDHYRDILITEENLVTTTYEELSMFFSTLWVQLEILNHGIALGSVLIKQRRPTSPGVNQIDEFELHYLVDLYRSYLSTARLPVSLAVDEYFQENNLDAPSHALMFDWSALAYIVTALKSPIDIQDGPSASTSDFLNVVQPESLAVTDPSKSSYPYEVVPLAHMRDALGHGFQMFSDAAARLFLSHIHHLGFFERLDLEPILFHGPASHEQTYCAFPFPLGLDLSTDVETLVTAVEACLSDLDLSSNEVGFLLLVRKFWPNGMASDYASRRLARSIVAWILAEEDKLAVLASHDRGPDMLGVRGAHETLPWPFDPRTAPSSSNNLGGGDYVDSRHALANKYAARWLLALHDQERTLYADMLYELCVDLAQSSLVADDVFLGPRSRELDQTREAADAGRTIQFLVQLSKHHVTFTVFDDVLTRWLENITDRNLYEKPIPSLVRLFNREVDPTYRMSTIDAPNARPDIIGAADIDPWRVIMKVASQDEEGLSRSLRWLCLLAQSGIDIPVAIYLQFSTLAEQFDASLADSALLAKCGLFSAWQKGIGRQDLQKMFSALHVRLMSQVVDSLQSSQSQLDVFLFIRHSLAACLLIYGFERDLLVSLDMVTAEEAKSFPSRKRSHARASAVSDPITIDPSLLRALESYLEANIDEVTCLVGQFMNLFTSGSRFLEPYEIDNFILRNGNMLCKCAWQLYDIQRHEISSSRTSFLLRVLVVDSQPFQALLERLFSGAGSWELRFVTVSRLFRIILDVTSPAFEVEKRQWRSSVADIFYYYFNALWKDDREEIRLGVDTWSKTLLPAHFNSITLCWNETLVKAPIAERVKLISFLLQLHPHFPTWRVLSWDVIVETLLEGDYMWKNGADEDGPASAHLSMYGLSSSASARENRMDPDLALLHVSTISLSLQMIADGVAIDIYSLLRVKEHLVQIVGFDDVSAVPAANGQTLHIRFGEFNQLPELAFPCIADLLVILDASHPFDLSPSAMGSPYEDDTPSTLLVGSIFVDVSLSLLNMMDEPTSLPTLVLKNMLEALIVIIYKHDFESRPLKTLIPLLRKAVRQAMLIFLQDTSYEIRQVALSVTQAYVKRTAAPGAFTCECLENAAKLVVLLHHNGEDILVAQARSFIETTLVLLSNSSILYSLARRTLDRQFFVVVKHITDADARKTLHNSESLRDVLLRTALPKICENDFNTFQTAVNNIHTYIDVVHHEHYSSELMQFIGARLTEIATKSSELAADEFDPNPLLDSLSTLIQHNKTSIRDMLASIDTVLRVSLIRFNVSAQCLTRFLRVTSTLWRRPRPRQDPAGPAPLNKTDENIFEIVGGGLRMRARVLPSTLASLIEAITSSDSFTSPTPPPVFAAPFFDMADAGFHFLSTHVWSDVRSENDFNASMSIAKMILQVAERDVTVLEKRVDMNSEKFAKQNLTVRAWNIMAIAALSNESDIWVGILYAQFAAFSNAYFASLRPYIMATAGPSESAMADVNHAYAAIKLWLMTALRFRTSDTRHGDDMATRVVWNELWPPFESLVRVFEADALTGHTPVLATSTWSSVADLFLFIRQTRSSIALESASHIAILERLRKYGRAESSNSKLSRALQTMSEPPADVALDALLSQASKDVVAAEKLLALESRRKDLGKTGDKSQGSEPRRKETAWTLPDRSRRDVRIVS